MSQRNFMNERYNDENRTGKSRKSASSVKPKAQRAATVRDPAPKSKKQKKQEQREREQRAYEKSGALQARFEDTEVYKRLRRLWWIFLSSAIVCTALSFVFQRDESLQPFSLAVMIAAYALIIAAFYIDLGKIRKERKLYGEAMLNDKSKAARKEQKRLRAEQREQEREAAEKFEAAKAEEEEKKAKRGQGFLARFRKKDEAQAVSGKGGDSSEEASQQAPDKREGASERNSAHASQ